ncbi:MAG: macro domain-containing protein [Planctomycetes bacterium]|nr:macro domain-containing protein [Planctomycetota bacterium]
MSTITYLKGDATCPQATGNKVLCHIASDRGRWGKGFVVAISKRWKTPEEEYRRWYKERTTNDFALSAVQFVQAESQLWVANMIGQHGMTAGSEGPPIRYEAVRQCLEKVRDKALELSASVHMPRIGCGLAGGKWPEIQKIIEETLCAAGLEVFVYDFE